MRYRIQFERFSAFLLGRKESCIDLIIIISYFCFHSSNRRCFTYLIGCLLLEADTVGVGQCGKPTRNALEFFSIWSLVIRIRASSWSKGAHLTSSNNWANVDNVGLQGPFRTVDSPTLLVLTLAMAVQLESVPACSSQLPAPWVRGPAASPPARTRSYLTSGSLQF